ncbi:hypothetical protein BWQ96_07335 [Gracilariopsis chorda]|uniref:PI31 proteasome regulator N-terminal domain-containing protein n=1 Tax=Gracilariopsis chorda TaxID=448386 RepID=A0A2V3ILN3_9FLOR|nr:hypothetical protein BWQ96_07335 [Gracilariopsis chorda]|eukprot:PXF42957.1 hypothetical protein BWQ96_07335 [Gracilariopsis chorda]
MSSQQSAAERALQWLSAREVPQSERHETVALAVHALLLAHGFRVAEVQAGDSSAQQQQQLPAVWGQGAYGGAYRHERSAMQFDIRASKVGGKLVWNATAMEDDAQVFTLQVRVGEYVGEGGGGGGWRGALRKLNELATLVAVQMAHKLVPDSAKAGYEAAASTEEEGTASSSSAPRVVRVAVPVAVPVGVAPEHDPLRIGAPRMPRMGMPVPGRQPFGSDDLLPAGLLPGGAAMGGGNLMGPRHFRRGEDGGWRPPGVPPGARFDPYVAMPDNDAELPPGFDDEHALRAPRADRFL